MRLKNLSDDLGRIESPKMRVHDNCDISRSLSCLLLACVVTYATKHWATKFDKLKGALTYVDACLYFYFSYAHFSDMSPKLFNWLLKL